MDEAQTIEGYEEEIADETALPAQETDSRINGGTAFLMIFFGFAVDAVQVFLDFIIIGIVLNYIIGFYTWLTFFVWIKWRGMSMWEGRVGMKILGWLLFSVGLELFTAGAAPGWGIFATAVVITEYSSKVPIIGKMAKK